MTSDIPVTLRNDESITAESENHPAINNAYLFLWMGAGLGSAYSLYRNFLLGINEPTWKFFIGPAYIFFSVLLWNRFGLCYKLLLTNQRLLVAWHHKRFLWAGDKRVTSVELNKITSQRMERTGIAGVLGFETLVVSASGHDTLRLPFITNAASLINAISEAAARASAASHA